MPVSAGADYSYSVLPGTSVVDQRSATLHGKAATVVVANWGTSSDQTIEDKVSLSSDLSQNGATTPTAKLTAALGNLLKSASHVDLGTGVREITQGASDTLSSEVSKLLVGSGFSAVDAANASSSLVKQFSSATAGASILALSLSSQSDKTGNYSKSVSGGTETSAYAIHSVSALSISFDTGTGNLSVKLDQHKVASTKIEWSSSVATDVSISLSQPELEAIGFTPVGTFKNETSSPVSETQTTTSQDLPGNGIGSSNIAGPGALASYLALESGPNSSSGIATSHSTTATVRQDASIKTSLSNSELALISLKKLVAQVRSSNAEQAHTISLAVSQKIGTAVIGQTGSRSLIFNRPDGHKGLVDMGSVNTSA